MDRLYYVVLSEIVISAIISAILIIAIIIGKRYKAIFYQTITSFVIISFIHSLSFIINWNYDNKVELNVKTICQVQSFIMIASQFSQLLWMTLISLIFYYSMKKNQQKEKKSWLFIFLICTILPIIITLIYYFVGWFGKNNKYCWISDSIAAGIIIYAIIWMNIAFNLFLTYRMTIILSKIQCGNEEEKKSIKRSGVKLFFYPGSQVFVFIIPTVYYIYSICITDKTKVIKFFDTFSTFMLCFQGIFFPIVYGYNSEIIKSIRYCCNSNKSFTKEIFINEEISLLELNNSNYSEALDI